MPESHEEKKPPGSIWKSCKCSPDPSQRKPKPFTFSVQLQCSLFYINTSLSAFIQPQTSQHPLKNSEACIAGKLGLELAFCRDCTTNALELGTELPHGLGHAEAAPCPAPSPAAQRRQWKCWECQKCRTGQQVCKEL